MQQLLRVHPEDQYVPCIGCKVLTLIRVLTLILPWLMLRALNSHAAFTYRCWRRV